MKTKPRGSKLPSRKKLRQLAETMSYAEIGRMYGVKGPHVKRVIQYGHGYQLGLGQPQIHAYADPRDHLPLLSDHLTDEQVETWDQTHTCLCGCGTAVGQRKGADEFGPRGSYHYFAPGHIRRMQPYRELQKTRTKSNKTRAKLSASMPQRSVPTDLLGLIVTEFIEDNELLVKDFAAYVGFSPTWLTEVRTGRKKSIRRSSAARLMQACGEELTPELKLALGEQLPKKVNMDDVLPAFAEDVEFLIDSGERHRPTLCARLGVSPENFDARLRRAGRSDLINRTFSDERVAIAA